MEFNKNGLVERGVARRGGHTLRRKEVEMQKQTLATNTKKKKKMKYKRRNKFTRAVSVFRVARIKINKNMATASSADEDDDADDGADGGHNDDHYDVGAMQIDPGVRRSTVRTINQWGRRRRRRSIHSHIYIYVYMFVYILHRASPCCPRKGALSSSSDAPHTSGLVIGTGSLEGGADAARKGGECCGNFDRRVACVSD